MKISIGNCCAGIILHPTSPDFPVPLFLKWPLLLSGLPGRRPKPFAADPTPAPGFCSLVHACFALLHPSRQIGDQAVHTVVHLCSPVPRLPLHQLGTAVGSQLFPLPIGFFSGRRGSSGLRQLGFQLFNLRFQTGVLRLERLPFLPVRLGLPVPGEASSSSSRFTSSRSWFTSAA